jgi:nitric oxide reductase NorD protein
MAAPSLDFDWEQGIFRALRGLWRRVTPAPEAPYEEGRAAVLTSIEGRLTAVAQVLSGEAVRVLPARSEGGLRGRDLLLPAYIDVAPDPDTNRGLYVLRIAVAATWRRMGCTAPDEPCAAFIAALDATDRAVADLSETFVPFADAWAEATALVLQHRPSPADLHGRGAVEEAAIQALLRGEARPADLLAQLRAAKPSPRPPVVLWGALVRVDMANVAAATPENQDPELPPSDATEAAAPTFEELKVVAMDEDDALPLPVHVFEKVETAEAFNGRVRDLDGADELDDHLEALEEVDLAELVRGGEQARSVLRADIALDADIPDIGHDDPNEPFLLYDEWDGRRRKWKKDWCRVLPTPMPRLSDDRWAKDAVARNRRHIEQIYQRLANHRALRTARNRQTMGEDIDIDALVDARADLAAGCTPSQRLYIRQERQPRDVATTVLLDVSMSADSWVANRRVMDVARDATLVLGEVAERLGDRLQVLAFASQTRNRVRVWELRGWKDPWSDGRTRLGALNPQGYTRIGPAIRHATAELTKMPARERLLLLISDGKPTDYDQYEGRYGIADVRQAIREANGGGVRVHALAVDAVAKDWLPSMLGPGAWHLVHQPDQLVEALATVYGRLT